MTSSTELSACIAKSFGIAEATALLHMRIVREAGILTQGGRGRSAARMTSRDAAHLLVAIAGASAVKDSTIPILGAAQTWVASGTWYETLRVPEMLALPEDHRFVAGLTALIEAAKNGSIEALATEIEGSPVDLANDLLVPFAIEVTIAEPQATAFIEVIEIDRDGEGSPVPGERRRMQYGKLKKLEGGNLRTDPPLNTAVPGDLRHHHTFTHRTIQAIGNLLRDT